MTPAFGENKSDLSNSQVEFKISTLENVFQAAPQQAPASNFIIEYGKNEPPKSEEQPASSRNTEKNPCTEDIIEEITRNPNDELYSGNSSTVDLVQDWSDILLADNYQFASDLAAIEDSFPDQNEDHHSGYKSALMHVPARNSILSVSNYPTTSTASSPSSSGGSVTNDIPRSLSPLPDILIEVPYYRDLFYHFVHITADVLVPVPRELYPDNPFRTILPKMALSTPHLLSLLLAYAASHRAKYTKQPEPAEIISQLLGRTFEGLTKSLENEKEARSDSTLATAVMLASYEVLSAAVDDSWKTHLHGAREIVVARGMADSLSGGLLTPSEGIVDHRELASLDNNSAVYGPHPLRVLKQDITENEASYFLLRTFAYIDVIGALSSSSASSVLVNNQQSGQLWTVPINSKISHGEGIDFLLGVDLNVIPMFSKVSSLARRRRELPNLPEHLQTAEEADIDAQALELSDILYSCCQPENLNFNLDEPPPKPRPQSTSSIPSNSVPNASYSYAQLNIMNLTFCYAALIHLYRRVLLFPTDSETIQSLVRSITDLLETHIPLGSSIEACMSFPIFTAGCEALDGPTREKYRQRIKGMHRFGVGQIFRANELMEKCWEQGRPWTEIMDELGWDLVLL
ncbi:hypothetical protein TRICI_004070 [Trichomonascus ciferrii]|uniref:Transcription factor domain-containing protein n=1 Tax=Trichomonascus ciferrii TaxID=44093 RepID=A0A642V209_9ASCO|nr:hypothetical protein TRICI_004070 [Trichomonascus ciferrii]